MLLIIENVLSAEEAREFRAALGSGPWQDGRASAGTLSVAVKDNQQLQDGSELSCRLGNRILALLGRNPLFISAALPHRIFPPRFNRYSGGGHYGPHTDGAIMYHADGAPPVRSDVSATLFLSPPEDYDGGELSIETAFGAQEVKLAAGDMVLYPSSSLHEVAPVTRGERVAAILWLQSMVRSDTQRGLLFDLDQSIQAFTRRSSPSDPELLRLTAVYHNLLRMWAET